ncbi:hypothetical protein SAMN06298216_0837 [Spirosomataceae bacterium TFI 002]|nr:hypothetical protein SAMN06298216_0837 [Spirosomataceae bacterium TFI 002]
MNKILSVIFFSFITFLSNAQAFISMEVVEIQNQNEAEAIYYFQNNWEQLRIAAKKQNYIDSYTWYVEGKNQRIYLITNFGNIENWEKREENFGLLIKEAGPLKLLNEKQPSEFRKSIDHSIKNMTSQ